MTLGEAAGATRRAPARGGTAEAGLSAYQPTGRQSDTCVFSDRHQKPLSATDALQFQLFSVFFNHFLYYFKIEVAFFLKKTRICIGTMSTCFFIRDTTIMRSIMNGQFASITLNKKNPLRLSIFRSKKTGDWLLTNLKSDWKIQVK